MEHPLSPGHCLKILNQHVRTDILVVVHGMIHEQKSAHPSESPIKHIINAISETLKMFKDFNNFKMLKANPMRMELSTNSISEKEKNFKNDIELLKFHLKALKNNLSEIC